MTPLKSSLPYRGDPDPPRFLRTLLMSEYTWYGLKLPALRTLRSYLRAALQHTNIILDWDTSFNPPCGYEGPAFGVYHRHRLSWRFRPGCRDAGANFRVRRRLHGKRAAHHLHCVNRLITIHGDEVSDRLWDKVLRKARHKLCAITSSVPENSHATFASPMLHVHRLWRNVS